MRILCKFVNTKDIERTTKENKTIGKRKKHREESLLLEKCFELGLTTENPHSVKSNDVTLKKEDLVKLLVKLGCDEAFKKTNPMKKFVNLNRTEQYT